MRLISEEDFRRQYLGDISPSTLLRIRKADPRCPQPVQITPQRKGYREDQAQEYAKALVETGPADTSAETGKAA